MSSSFIYSMLPLGLAEHDLVPLHEHLRGQHDRLSAQCRCLPQLGVKPEGGSEAPDCLGDAHGACI